MRARAARASHALRAQAARIPHSAAGRHRGVRVSIRQERR
ncbi:hypothetical protein BURPSPAST_Z0173 [Burkholderia pseudomallei Pasteur 52237]|nr:hypothetical protein BURPSPAST_Z0173 [Burkholderia pseudomallei Pasteur 52237]EDU09268.1 hypothetical protein BURPS1655_K0602 [Burkholderia pseudomallei 1655]